MKEYLAAAFVIVLAGAATAQARVEVSVNFGIPVAVAAPPPATVVTYPSVTYPAYAPAPVPVAYADPGFIYSPRLGFYVSVGLPYDVVYLDNCYYHFRNGRWYMSPTYGGGWSYLAPNRVPYQLHRHGYDRIVYYRDREYRRYLDDRHHYRGRWYRPEAMHRQVRWDDRGIDRDHRWGRDRDRDGYRDGYRDRDRDGYRDRDRGRDWDHDRGRR